VATTKHGRTVAQHGVLGTHAAVTVPRTPATTHRTDHSLVVHGQPLFPVQVAALHRLAGRYATASGVRVLAVVGDRIFWIGSRDGSQLLVHLQGPGTRYAIRTGQRLAFTSVVTRNAPRSATAWGLTYVEGLGRLRAQGMHLEVYGPRIRFR
jgi:hypothetical protein